MKVDWNSKYTTMSVYTILTFAVCLCLVISAMKFSVIWSALGEFIKVISPIIWGIVIAYLLNPVERGSERFFKKIFEKKKAHSKLCRVLGTFVSVIFGGVAVYALVDIVVTQVIDSLMTIFANIDIYMNNIYNMINSTLSEYPEIVTYLNAQLDTVETTIVTTVNNLIPKVGDWALKLKDGAVGLLVGLKDFVIGFIVAVYLLVDKEKFLAQSKKCVIAVFPDKLSTELLRVCNRTNKTLSGFIMGKVVDSFIIGVICFISMTILKFEYPVLISTIVGVTNVIPFFGPFFGAIPSALLLLISYPSQTIPFLILILAIQQFDGNILGPFILGDSTGLPAVWVMFAIFVGGGLFGFPGMILGVPIFAVIYAFTQEFVEYMLTKKGLSTATADYIPAEPEPVKRKPLFAKKEKEAKK